MAESFPATVLDDPMGRHMCQKCNISVDLYIGREIYISDGGYTYLTGDIHIGREIYISDGRYRYRTEDIHIGREIYYQTYTLP